MKRTELITYLILFLSFSLIASIYFNHLKTGIIDTQSEYVHQLEGYIDYWYNKSDSLVRENSALKLYIIENK